MKKSSVFSVFLLALLIANPSFAQKTLKFKVIGQPSTTGLIQSQKEAPFFTNFKKNTKLPIEMSYVTVDASKFQDTELLRAMKAGVLDIASLRLSQISRDEISILGLDLVGINPDYESAKKTVQEFSPYVDQRLQKEFGVKLLGVWPFGPQIFFCKKPITGLVDIKGLKVRIADQGLAKFIYTLGGIPVPIAFDKMHQNLSLGTIDCVVTGSSSGNSARIPEVTTHYYPLGVQFAFNAYAITLSAWNKMSREQQIAFQTKIDAHVEDIWKYSEMLFIDASSCNIGKEPCTKGKKYKMINVPISETDLALLNRATQEISFPNWADICDRNARDCSMTWKETVGARLGVK